MDFNRHKRNAVEGEFVWYYPRGMRLNAERQLALVTAVTGMTISISVHREKGSRHLCHEFIRHIDDPHWEGEGRAAVLAQKGAWDFHDVYGLLFNRVIASEKMRESKLAQLAEAKTDISEDEFNAQESLGRHGPLISKIAEDTGMSKGKLRGLPGFMAEFKKAKDAEWKKKNGLVDEITEEPLADDASDTDDGKFVQNWKKAAKTLGMSQTEWDEWKSLDGFPMYVTGKGWPIDEIRGWMESTQVEAV